MILVPLVFWLLFTSTISILSKKSFGKCIPLSMISATFILYFSQLLLGTFYAGYAILIVVSCLSIPLYVMKNDRKQNAELIFSIGLISFISIYVLYIILDYKRRFTTFDEWYHWGMMVKESLRLDKFYSVAESNLHIHKDYPPFISILEVIFCKFSGGYSESKASMGIHVFTLSLIVPWILDKLQVDRYSLKKKIGLAAIYNIMILGVILILDPWWSRISTTILVDVLIAVIFAYSFLTIWFMKKVNSFDLCCIVLANSAMVMIKQVCLGFAMVLALAYLLRHVFGAGKRANLLSWIIVWLIPFVNYAIWGLYVKKLGVEEQFSLGKIDIKSYLRVVAGKETGLRRDTFIAFIKALYKNNISSLSSFNITYVSATLIVLSFVFLLHLRYKERFGRKSAIQLGIVFLCGTIGYAFMMSILYLFCFNSGEMKELASYDRYMASYILGEVLALFTMFVIFERKQWFVSVKKVLIVTLAIMVLLGDNIMYMVPQMNKKTEYEIYEDYAEKLSGCVERNSKVFIIYDAKEHGQSWYGPTQIFVNYYANDLAIDYNYNDSFATNLSDEQNREKIEKEILSNNYLYIINTNDNVNNLSYLAGEEFTDNTIYKVVDDKLIKIAEDE